MYYATFSNKLCNKIMCQISSFPVPTSCCAIAPAQSETTYMAWPNEIASFGILMYPFDSYTWAFVFGAAVGEFIILIIMQLIWSGVIGKSTPRDFVYQGKEYKT